MSDRNTQKWFHGTRRGFTRGGYLFPRNDHGGPGTTAPTNPGMTSPEDSADWVHITRDPVLAWAYAWSAPGRGKPKVLTVEPHGPVEDDPEHSVRMDAWRCEWAKVVAVDTDPALSEEEALAGWATD